MRRGFGTLHWAEDLKLDKNCELVNEHEYRSKRLDIDPYKQREMDKFQMNGESASTQFRAPCDFLLLTDHQMFYILFFFFK